MRLVCSTIEYNREKSKHSFVLCVKFEHCLLRKFQSLSYLVCCFALDVVILVMSV